jgi:hypothetical protein
MMFSSNVCRFAFFSFLSLSANADTDTVLGVQRQLSAVEAAVPLGTAANYAILAKTGISTVPTSAITGDIAVSPAFKAAIAGFSLYADLDDPEKTTSVQLTGHAYAAEKDEDAPVTVLLKDAVSDMETAYTDAAGRTNTNVTRINYGDGILGGALKGGPSDPLTPGLYTFTTDVHLTDNLHFHGTGTATDIFIIQMTGSLLQAANSKVILSGGALAKNIFWQVAGDVYVSAGAHMEGLLLVKTSVTFITGSYLKGHIFTQTLCALQMATISAVGVLFP